MTAAELQLSHPIELEIKINGKKTTLISGIEKMVNQTILLTPIQMNGKLVGFPPECEVNLLYIDESHVYCWRNVQIKAVKYDGKVYHGTQLIADAEILNRRGAYRVYIGEEMLMTAFTAKGPKSHRVLVKDISESGLAFLSSEEFDVGRTVRFHLKIASGKELQLSAQILRTQEQEGTRTLYGCKLLERSPHLTNYLMRIQQDRRRQQLGM